MSTHPSDSAAATERLGERLAGRLAPGDILLLAGEVAAGKTTLVRGLVRGLGGDAGEVTSPSFVLVQSYPAGRAGIVRLHHIDLYRLADRVRDLRELGLEELLSDGGAVVAVEWPRGAIARWIPPAARVWRITLEITGGDRRAIRVEGPEDPADERGVPRPSGDQ